MTEDELTQTVAHIHELLDRNRFVYAKQLLTRALPHFPDDEDLLYCAAYIALREGDIDQSKRHTVHLLEVAPASYTGRTLMADVLEEQEQYAESEQMLLSLLADYPDDASALASYAMLMLRTMHVDKARKLAEEALRHEPDNVTGMQVTTLASIVQGDRSGRDERLAEMIKKHPEVQATAATLTHVLQREGRHTEALHVSQEMLRAEPDNQDIVELVIGQRLLSHWSMIPMRPFVRYGWAASIGLWFAAVVLFQFLPDTLATQVLLGLLLLFVAYSWIWPWCLGKILKR